MKNKIIITILLVIFSSDFTIANFYQRGDTLNVWAVSGLLLREGPGTEFPATQKLEYGTSIAIIDEQIQKHPMSLQILKAARWTEDYFIKGYWVKVKSGKNEGYVFDGYLSRLPVINIKKGKEGEHNSWFPESLSDYVERTIGSKINAVQKVRKGYINTTIEANKWISLYKSEGDCNESRITLEDMTFGEAYLFFNVLHRFEEKIKLYQTTNINIYNCRARIILEKYLLKTKEATLRERHGKFYIYEGGCC